jgi:hypothetical protein
MKIIFILLFVPMAAFSMDRLSALSLIESANNDRAVGRAGEISRYQILKREWRSVTRSTNYRDPALARQVTLTLIDRRLERFQQIYGRTPTDFEFYALWNAPGQVFKRRVSPTVAERAHRFANLCRWDPEAVPGAVQRSPRPALRVS